MTHILCCDACKALKPSDTSAGWGRVQIWGASDRAWKLQARQADGSFGGIICPECVSSLEQWWESRRDSDGPSVVRA
jgi:hypothetical protein